jgi:hypothetical protein
MTNSTSLTIGQTAYTTTTVGDHSFANISVADFLEVPPAPIQRNSERRVGKMKPIFDEAYAAKQTASLTEVVLGIIAQDFDDTDPDTGAVIASYTAGQVFILDGNTRRFYWKLNPERAKELTTLTAKIHYLSSMEDMKFAYYPYNSKESVEKAGEILQGLARRYNWQPKQTMFQNGGYKTALDWASFEDGDIHQRFNEHFEELKLLDSIPKSGHTISQPAMKCLKSQPIMAALLITLKNNKNNLNLYEFIERLSNITEDDCKKAIAADTVTPVEVIALEWKTWSKMRGNNTDTTWLNGLAGTTKFASREPQLDFLLYWISEFIKNPKCTNNFNKGIRPTFWENFLGDNFV